LLFVLLLFERLLDRLDEVRGAFVVHQLGGVFLRFLALRIFVGRHPLVGVIEYPPDYLHAHDFRRPRARLGFGFRLGLGLGLLLFFLGRRFLVVFARLFLFLLVLFAGVFGVLLLFVLVLFLFVHLLFHFLVFRLATLRGLVLGPFFLAVDGAACH